MAVLLNAQIVSGTATLRCSCWHPSCCTDAGTAKCHGRSWCQDSAAVCPLAARSTAHGADAAQDPCLVSAFPSSSMKCHLASLKLQTSCLCATFAATSSAARGPREGAAVSQGKEGRPIFPARGRQAQQPLPGTQPCPAAMRCAEAPPSPCSPSTGRGAVDNNRRALHQALLTTRSTALKRKHHRKEPPHIFTVGRRGFEFTGQTSPRERC